MRNIHIVSHTHWDREWYLPFQSFRLKLVQLIDNLLELLERDPHFKYFMLDGQTIVLDDYLALRPGKEAILRNHIRKGRILIGPWHILPDMFLVGPESHIRNLLQGDRTARKFGPKMMIGYIPDPFGHPGQVPQILRGFGIETACLWRGLGDEPAEFWWQSPDGSRVLMVYLRDSYSNGASLPADNLPMFVEAINLAADSLAAHSSVPDQLIMFGNDHMEPPPGTSKAIAYANRVLGDTRVFHSTLPEFVTALQQDIRKQKLALTLVTGELRGCKHIHLLPGVLSTRIWIKQRNHNCENLLVKWAEPYAVFQEYIAEDSFATALKRKSEIIPQVWRMLMENHPHDSICGCSIDQVHNEMEVRFDQVDQIGEELVRQSLESVAGVINTQPSASNLVTAIEVFNPTSSTRTDLVNLTLELPQGIEEFDLVNVDGASLPYQRNGLGKREIINVCLDGKGLQSAFGFISEGRAAGMSIHAIKVRREGSQVYIDAIMSDSSEPNLSAWKAARKQVDDLLVDPTITDYHVRARTPSAAELVFVAPQVPGLGYRTFWLRPHPGQEKTLLRFSPLARALLPLVRLPFLRGLVNQERGSRLPHKIENEYFLVEVMNDGTLSVLDKQDGRQYAGLNRMVDGGDCGDEYNFCPPETDCFITPNLDHISVETGPVQQSLKIDLVLRSPDSLAPGRKSRSKKMLVSHISSRVTLSRGVRRVDICTRVENTARDHRLRVHFPAPFAAETGSHDGHFEVVDRKIGLPPFDETWSEQPRPEVPQRAFTDISDGSSGLMLANRGLPEIEVLKNPTGVIEIALTLLRCVGWLSRDDLSTRKGHAGPFMETPGAQMPGEWNFDYSVIPHSADWRSTFRDAYAFENPLRAIPTNLHDGSLPPTGSLIDISPDTFVISAVKHAENGNGWLVRGYNITTEPIDVTIKPWKPYPKIELVNLAEAKQASLKADKYGAVVVPVSGHAIVSVIFRE